MSIDLSKLIRFEESLKRANPEDATEFRRLLNEGIDLLTLLHKDVAEEFAMSRPSVTRWMNGNSAPHPALRPAIYRWLASRAGAIRRRETEKQQSAEMGARIPVTRMELDSLRPRSNST